LLEELLIREISFAPFMSGISKKKDTDEHSSLPASPAGEMPEAADSRPMKSGSFVAGLNDRWLVPGICIFLAAITFAVFGQTLGYEFVNYDDELYVTDNTVILGGLSLNGIVWVFTHSVASNWHPLTMMSHMLDCQLYGLDAGGHHLTNVLLHTASVILLFLVLRQMTGFLWRSAFVAAVFAIHPLRVESVAWVAERKDVLSGLFFMLTLWAYVRYVQKQLRVEGRESSTQAFPALDPLARRSEAKTARLWTLDYYLVLLFFALGLMSKPMLVTLPFVLLLLDCWPLKRFTQPGGRLIWHLVAEKVPLLALSGAICMITLFTQQDAIQSVPLSLRIDNALVSYVAYLGQMFVPVGLAVDYPFPASSLPLWKILAALVLLLIISIGAIAARRKHPYFLFGWLWYLGMLVPVIGILQTGSHARADRYTYLPQIGLYLLLTWAAADLCAGWRHRRVVLGGVATVILMALIFRARVQTSYWRNSELLWTHTLACTSDNFIGHDDLGNALLQKGKVDEAITHFQQALQLKPDSAEVHNNLGSALAQKGSLDEAIPHFQKALEIRPDYGEACYNLGTALLQRGDVNEAIARYQTALQINPDSAAVRNNLDIALRQKSKVDDVLAQYQKALQINPDSPEVLNNLAWLLATCPDANVRNGVQAVKYAERACELTHHGVTPLVGTLAAAYAEAGRYDDAMATAQKACALAEKSGEQDLLKRNQELLVLYRAHQPYHEPAAH
jgi:Flp pilus assembly protein TadD